jgi:dCMP deaminase
MTTIIDNGHDMLGRPSFDLWFMTISFMIAQRSLDPATKCGCVVVDDSNSILSVGYNSPPRGCVDEVVPLTRPEKYLWMAHAEANAIANAAKCGIRLDKSTFYVTGPPCIVCFRAILNSGAKRLVYGPNKAVSLNDEEEKAKYRMLNDAVSHGLKPRDFIMEEYCSIDNITNLLQNTSTYLIDKFKSNN